MTGISSLWGQSRRALNRLSQSHTIATTQLTGGSSGSSAPINNTHTQQHTASSSLTNTPPTIPTRDDTRRQAIFRLGESHLFGRDGYPHEPKLAITYFIQASNRGMPLAMSVLGFCHEFGIGCQMDFIEAERLYIEAASLGDGMAYARLAFLRKYGRPGVKIDRVEADEWQARANQCGPGCVQWLKTAAETFGDSSAQYALGVCYHDGVGVSKDEQLAIKCTCCVPII
jgi:TPR repeat protein